MTPYYFHNFFKPYFYTKTWNVHHCRPVAVCNLAVYNGYHGTIIDRWLLYS